MNFCCGADMLLTIAHLNLEETTMRNVPILFCLACENMNIHPDVELEFELLKEYACGDRAGEVDLQPYVNRLARERLYDPKNHVEYLRMEHVVKEQIDRALEMYSVAQSTEDPEWKEELVQRLVALNEKGKKKVQS
ncbi:hypothetical protein [Ammoniphilus sp. CFH 90114]|uniref:hypothetical protein n=1 Tax=Ammoniphilus sp. CFH 90114 TaxID=2493665 RepID=UPI00100E8425|nr:hypothetical protein [Ammoniphilus sp. CFH 90114]RXT07840.1 hypothetical protein EIZ39_10455 [Ammoniphilus sp. CFH 90114]